MKSNFIRGLGLALAISFANPAVAQLRKLNMAYTATSPYQAVVVIAKDAGLFKKYNLDVTLIFMGGGSLGLQAMIGGDVPMIIADGSAAVGSRLAGSDAVVIASFLNTFPYSLVSLPEIKRVEQLKGGRIAISRFGSATDTGVKMALAQAGLNPDRDMTLLQIGAQTARFSALQAKTVEATIITPPFTLTTRKLGYPTLLDMADQNIPFQMGGLLSTRGYLKSNPDTAQSVMRALAEAIHFYKKEKDASLKILARYLKIDDRDALEETHREVALRVVPEKPYPTLAGIQTILDELGRRNPKAKAMRPEEFVDASLVKKLDDEGLFERLYKR